MNSNTYHEYSDAFAELVKDELVKEREKMVNDAALFTELVRAYTPPTIEIDETVPDGLVRLAGNRYVTKDQFLRMQRRAMR